MFRRFRIAWRLSQSLPYLEQYESWTNEDATALAEAFQALPARKFRHRLANAVTQTALWACQQPADHAYHAGFAKGVAYIDALIEQHFPRADALTGIPEESDGAAVNLETLAP